MTPGKPCPSALSWSSTFDKECKESLSQTFPHSAALCKADVTMAEAKPVLTGSPLGPQGFLPLLPDSLILYFPSPTPSRVWPQWGVGEEEVVSFPVFARDPGALHPSIEGRKEERGRLSPGMRIRTGTGICCLLSQEHRARIMWLFLSPQYHWVLLP